MDKKITVVCTGIVSSYHLSNIYALIDTYHSKSNVFLYVSFDHYWGENIIPQRYIDYGIKNYNLVICNNNIEKKLEISNEKINTFVFIGVTYVSYVTYFKLKFRFWKDFNRSSIFFYSIDEGLGSHLFTYLRVLKRQLKEVDNKLLFLLSYNLRFFSYKILDFIFKTKHNRLYDYINTEVILNTYFAINLKNVFKGIAKLSTYNFESVDNIIVYLDQPLYEIGVCDEIYELTSLPSNICNFAEKNFLIPYVKPHPSRKKINNYLNVLGASDGCVEELFSVFENKNISVIGVTSNALLTANALFNINSFRICSNSIDLTSLKHNYKVDNFFEHFTRSVDLDEYIQK